MANQIIKQDDQLGLIAIDWKAHLKARKKFRVRVKHVEQVVLATLMSFNKSLELVNRIIVESSFYLENHRLIFRAICKLSTMNQLYNATAVSDWLRAHNLLDDVGGEDYLNELLQEGSESLINIRVYAEKVRDFRVLRELIAVSSDMLNIAYDSEGFGARMVMDKTKHKVFDFFEHQKKLYL